jgi:hypothetical protein
MVPRNRASALRVAGSALAAAALLVSAGRSNRAQSNEVNVDFHVFQDTRSVTVLSPTIDLTKDFTGRTTLRLSYGVDAISAASDSCARCHRDGVNSHRQVGALSITQALNDWKLTIGGSFGKESFYRATTGLTSTTRDLAKGSTTIAGGYAFSLNQPTLHPTETIRNQYEHTAYGTVTQTLTKSTIAQVGYDASSVKGYLDNPFLRTSVNGMGKLVWTVGVKDPDPRDQLLGTIDTSETSVSTSAEYANFVTIDGRAYGHILDPRTLYPSRASLSATVLSRDATLADAVSTAAFVLGPAAGLQLIESFDGMSGVIAYRRDDGRIGLAMTPGLKFRRANGAAGR